MAIINDIYQPKYAFLCIGDFYTMGPVQAAYSINKVIKKKIRREKKEKKI